MKLPRRPPSLAALAIVPVIALLTGRGGERPARADDALEASRGALLAYRGGASPGVAAKASWRVAAARPAPDAPPPPVPF